MQRVNKEFLLKVQREQTNSELLGVDWAKHRCVDFPSLSALAESDLAFLDDPLDDGELVTLSCLMFQLGYETRVAQENS